MSLVFLVLGAVCLIVALYHFSTQYKQDNGDVNSRLSSVESKYSPEMNRWAARREATAAQARTETLTALNQEAKGIVESLHTRLEAQTKQIELNHLPEVKEMELRERESQHITLLKANENTRFALDAASSDGVTLPTREEVYKMQASAMIEHEKKRADMLLGIEQKRLEKQTDLELGYDYNLRSHREIERIRKSINNLIEERERVWEMQISETVRAERLRGIDKDIKFFEEQIHERQRLLSSGSGEKVSGSNQDTEGYTDPPMEGIK